MARKYHGPLRKGERSAYVKGTRRNKKKTTRGKIYRPVGQFGPLGKSFIATLKFSETITLNPGTGVSADYVFSANGIAKPDQTAVPLNLHQPYGHDEMVQFYDHYTVVGSKCVVRAVNNINLPLYMGVALRDNSSIINIPARVLRETGGTKLKLMSENTGGMNNVVVSKTFSPRKFFGKAKGNIVGESELRGNMDVTASNINNPTEQAYYHCMVVPQTDTDNPGSQTLQVDIYYTVVFTEPKTLRQS